MELGIVGTRSDDFRKPSPDSSRTLPVVAPPALFASGRARRLWQDL